MAPKLFTLSTSRMYGFGVWVWCLGFRVWFEGLAVRVQGLEVRAVG